MKNDDLISRSELKKSIKNTEYFNEYAFGFICDIIDNAPIVERPYGEWKVNNYGEHVCSICGHYALYDEDQDNDYYEVQSSFCPNCGADMRGDKKT